MASEWVAILGYGILGGLALLLLPRLLLWLFGFTCCGVRRQSYASKWQSFLGNVETGSSFSRFQSHGAGGTPGGINIGVFLFGCYITIVLIVMIDISNSFSESSKILNNTTDVITLAPTNLIDFVTLKSSDTDFSILNFTQLPSSHV